MTKIIDIIKMNNYIYKFQNLFKKHSLTNQKNRCKILSQKDVSKSQLETAGFFACKKIKVNKKLMNKSNLFLAILDYFISFFCCHFDRRRKMNEDGKSNYYAIIPEEESLYRTG